MLRSVLMTLVLVLLTGCSTISGWFGRGKPEAPDKPRYNVKAAEEFSRGLKLLDDGKYEESNKVFKSISISSP